VMPVLEGLAKENVPLSIDTRKPEVARRALAAGAVVVNDVTGLNDPEMIKVCAGSDCSICIMHMLGSPESMQDNPEYENVTEEVRGFLLWRTEVAEDAGIARNRLWIDPGIGFGKTVDHNLQLLRDLEQFTKGSPYPVLVGVSRKSFLGKIAALDGAVLSSEDRLEATLAAQTVAQMKGARIIRAHDVRASRRAIEVCSRIMG